VLTVLGVLSAVVTPALSRLQRTRESAFTVELVRELTLARAHADARGAPAGVRFELGAGTLEMVQLSGGAIRAMLAPTGVERPAVLIAADFPGVSVESITHGDGGVGSGILWFGEDGIPQTRAADGTLIGPFSQDAVVLSTGGHAVTVRRKSGLIER
jgi:Tfp pilus assembly protein FimT